MTVYENDSTDDAGAGQPVTTDATVVPAPITPKTMTATGEVESPTEPTASDTPRAMPPSIQPKDAPVGDPKAIAPTRELAGLEVEVERKKPSLDEMRARLKQKDEDIKAQVEAIQDEVATLGDIVKETVRNRPLLVLGGLAAAGVLVGLWVGGWGKGKKQPKLPRKQQRLVDDFVKQTRKRIKRGEIAADDPQVARMVPMLYAPKIERKKEAGLLGTLFSTTVRVGLGIAVQKGLEHLSGGSDIVDVPEETIAAAEAVPPVSEV
ncbi:MAG: hypothetical protein RhofKO_18230 [Rhodothermales bacterium]